MKDCFTLNKLAVENLVFIKISIIICSNWLDREVLPFRLLVENKYVNYSSKDCGR